MLIGTIVLLLIATLMMPISALAQQQQQGTGGAGTGSTSAGTRIGVMESIRNEFNNRLQERKEEFQAARVSLAQLRLKTRAELQDEWEKMYGYKLEIREQLRSMQELTLEERQALKLQVQALIEDCKEIHVYSLEIREAARTQRRAIIDSVIDLRPGQLTTEEIADVEAVINEVV